MDLDFLNLPQQQTYRSSLLRPYEHSCGEAHADAWLAFHISNPFVYTEICILAEKMRVEVRRSYYSIEVIINVLRWHRDMKTNDEEFKISNNHKSFYGRMYEWHYACPDFFRKTRSFADELIFPDNHYGLLRGSIPHPS